MHYILSLSSSWWTQWYATREQDQKKIKLLSINDDQTLHSMLRYPLDTIRMTKNNEEINDFWLFDVFLYIDLPHNKFCDQWNCLNLTYQIVLQNLSCMVYLKAHIHIFILGYFLFKWKIKESRISVDMW